MELLVKTLLFSKFTGTEATNIGLSKEDVTISDYLSIKTEYKIEKVGMVVDKCQK